MPLSDQEIKHLLEKVDGCYMEVRRQALGDDLPYLEEALKCCNQIIENAPPHPHYFVKRAAIKYMILTRESFTPFDLESVIEDISKAIELDPDKGVYYRIRGVYLSYMMGKDISDDKRKLLLERIISDYKASIERDPSNSQTWLSLIECNILLHNFDDAISIYGSCGSYIKTKEAQLIRAWLGCLALAVAGDPIGEEDKRPLYDQTIRLGDDMMFSRIAVFLYKIQKKEDYKGKWEKAMEIHGLFINHLSWSIRGSLFEDLHRYEEALDAYNKAIQEKPDDVIVWGNKGLILEKLERCEEALKAFEKSIELKPEKVKFWIKKCNVLAKLGRYDEVFKVLDKEIELKYGKKYYIALTFANKLAELGRYEEALRAYDKVIELSPYNASAWYSRACIYSLKNDIESTLTNLSMAIELNSEYKAKAQEDEAFKTRWGDEDFKRIVG